MALTYSDSSICGEIIVCAPLIELTRLRLVLCGDTLLLSQNYDQQTEAILRAASLVFAVFTSAEVGRHGYYFSLNNPDGIGFVMIYNAAHRKWSNYYLTVKN